MAHTSETASSLHGPASASAPHDKVATISANDLTDDLDFDTLLSLESTFYETGYTQGHQDGLRQSQFESRVFGVEQGYLKGVAMGRMVARARLWKARLEVVRQQEGRPLQNRPQRSSLYEGSGSDTTSEVAETIAKASNAADDDKEALDLSLPPLQANERLQKTLEKHVEKLLVYVDPSTLSPANTDDDVADYDDRLKKAQAKMKVIERLVGEDTGTDDSKAQAGSMSNDIENPRIQKIAEF